MVNDRIDEFLALAIDASMDPDERRADAASEKLWNENKIIALRGPPGSGKTTVQKRAILRCHALGGRGFYGLPNNALAARMKELCGNVIQVGTCHSILGLDEPQMFWPSLRFYQMGLIDEISQLKDYHYHQIGSMFVQAERGLVLLLCGDQYQVGGYGENRIWHTTTWRNPQMTFKVDLHDMHRCKDPELGAILSELKTNYPRDESLARLRAPDLAAWYPVGPPTAAGMGKLFAKHKNTEVLVISRRGTEEVNNATLEARFPRFPPRAVVPGDVLSSSKNYVGGELKPTRDLVPSEFPVFVGMKAYITKTLRKDLDFVNGMQVEVIGWSDTTSSIRVRTKTDRTFEVTRWADPDMDHMGYYPLRVGYASTILRQAGAELEHVTIYLDVPNAAACAYTALSRVSTLKAIKIGGKITASHFAPAVG